MEIKKYIFNCTAENHCKQDWIFEIENTNDILIINNLEITEEEKPRGCFGHPKTISVLVKGMELEKIDVDTLKEADCIKDISCGQFLADCIETIKSQK